CPILQIAEQHTEVYTLLIHEKRGIRMIKVMVVDEQTLFREGIKAILKQTNVYEVVASLATAKEMMDFFQQEEVLPEVVLLNLHLSEKDAIRTIKYMKDIHVDTRFITLTEQIDEEAVIDAIIAGADGFLLKKHYADNLLQAIRNVYDGETIMSGSIARLLAQRIRMLSMDEKQYFLMCVEQSGYPFTQRELDVAYLLKEN